MKEPFGFLNLIKPPGMTSHDLVDEARRIFGIKRIGHGGTLDPGASGVLPLAVGRATKLFEYLQESVKLYRGEITFGISTTSHDAQGDILEKKEASWITKEKIEEIIPLFIGEIQQIPPQVSAIHFKGKRSYEWTRKGVKVDLEPRNVRIENIVIKKFMEGEFPKVILDVKSSPGMYMRALARDLGEKLETGAFLSFLVRLESGPFKIEDAYTLEEVKEKALQEELGAVLLKGDRVLSHIPKISISEQQKTLLFRANRLPLDTEPGKNLIQLYDEEEELIALGTIKGEKRPYYFQPVKIFD
ncbi:MAG: tRNA pseudouridine(55) synthase TruB [Firmicutes bacterium]|nr:tRNA pseudouridine(55) synthase TruB [Bacillota bacterium]